MADSRQGEDKHTLRKVPWLVCVWGGGCAELEGDQLETGMVQA